MQPRIWAETSADCRSGEPLLKMRQCDRTRRTVYFVTLLIGLTSGSSRIAAQITFHLLTELTSTVRRGCANPSRDQAAAQNKCQSSPSKKKEPPNLICVLPGTSDEEIAGGAHFDHVKTGAGVVDNWSGASRLPELVIQRQAGATAAYPCIHCLHGRGIRFGGLRVLREPPDQRTARQRFEPWSIWILLCLGPTEVWVSHSDDRLLRLLDAVAQSLHAPVRGMNVEKVGTSDSESSAHYKIPRITLHSVTQETLPILHTSKDSFDKNQDERLLRFVAV